MLWLERIWPRLSSILSLLLGGLCLAMTGVGTWAPAWLHILLLGVWGGSLCYLIGQMIRKRANFSWPGLHQGIQVLEHRHQIPHNSLTTLLFDQPAAGQDIGLWQKHQQRLRARLIIPGLIWARSPMARQDPHALRFWPVILAVVGLVHAGSNAPMRLLDWVNPGGMIFDTAPVLMLDAWVTPPAYTGLPPIMLAQASKLLTASDKALQIPVNSIIFARISASPLTPRLVINGQKHDFIPAGTRDWHIEMPVQDANLISIERGQRHWLDWPIHLIPDQPPVISMLTAPYPAVDQKLVVDFAARDDYGITQLNAVIQPKDKIDGKDTAPAQDFPLAGIGSKSIDTGSTLDLLAHPWAGLPVSLHLVAGDAARQQTRTESVDIILPERKFAHPVARQIIALRQELTLWPQTRRAQIADRLEALIDQEPALQTQPSNIIALASINRRLRALDDASGIDYAQSMLWQIALSLDQKQLERKADQLATARDALDNALQNPDAASTNKDALIDAVQQALETLHDAVIEELRARLARGENLPDIAPGPNQMLLDQHAIDRMISDLRDKTNDGAREQARMLLKNLDSLIEQAKNGLMAGANGTGNQPSDPHQSQIEKLGQDIYTIQQQQQKLMDQAARTRNRDTTAFNDMAQQQQSLRQKLGNAMMDVDQLGHGIPKEMGNAEQSMAQAIESLKGMRSARARIFMQEADDALQKTLQTMQGQSGRASMRIGSNGKGFGVLRNQGDARENTDPFGRPLPDTGNNVGGDVAIPDHDAGQMSREILDELRRRAGGMQRPVEEQDYLRRLLQQY